MIVNISNFKPRATSIARFAINAKQKKGKPKSVNGRETKATRSDRISVT
jgi:hypothetical protein